MFSFMQTFLTRKSRKVCLKYISPPVGVYLAQSHLHLNQNVKHFDVVMYTVLNSHIINYSDAIVCYTFTFISVSFKGLPCMVCTPRSSADVHDNPVAFYVQINKIISLLNLLKSTFTSGSCECLQFVTTKVCCKVILDTCRPPVLRGETGNQTL